MSIFDDTGKTPAQTRYETIKEKSRNLYQGEKNRCLASFIDLWGTTDNPVSMEEAQATLDLFEHDAYQLFVIHRAWQDFIKKVDVDYEYLTPPYEVTFNADGTVTLSEKDEESSSSE